MMNKFDEHFFRMGFFKTNNHQLKIKVFYKFFAFSWISGDLFQVVPVAGDFAQLRNLEM